MKPDKRVLSSNVNEQIFALIETLHRTEQRVQELTAGQVDTVTNRAGQTYVLRPAQEQLRHIEATKQAAILNALPAHIALLDAQGFIVSVNDAWRSFADANSALAPRYWIGINYLDVCDKAGEDGSSPGGEAAAGIRAVLNGETRSYSVEYACHSPVQQRWFLMIATPIADKVPGGAVIMHVNITERWEGTLELRESERRFSDLLQNVELLSVMLDSNARITFCNDYFLRLTGWLAEEILGQSWFDVFLPPDVQSKSAFTVLLAGTPEVWHHENKILTRSGERRLIRWSNSALRSGAGVVIGTASIGEDVTEQRQAELRIKHLNRVYAVLSGINALIIRVRERQELFEGACRIAIEQGEFRIALLGILDANKTKIEPVALACGDEKLTTSIKRILSDSQGALTPMTAQAIEQRKPIVSNDSQQDPNVLGRHKHIDFGVRAMVILPLIVADDVVGAMALYSSEIDFFHAEEMNLLTDLAGDIGYAIDHLDKQDRLKYLAYYDALTGLANRSLFLKRVAQYMRGGSVEGNILAVCLCDLERFKNINNDLGRSAGDKILIQAAEWLTRMVGDAALIARVDADRFAIVFPQLTSKPVLTSILEKQREAFLLHPFQIGGGVFRIAFKAGVALFPDDGTDAESLLAHAEVALEKAKAIGEPHQFYDKQMTHAMAGRRTMENQLRQALDDGAFVLHYQPKVSLTSGKLTGVEGLIRWNDPSSGLVEPARFIPILEESGLIHDVGRWVLQKAIDDFLRWRRMGLAAVPIAVNISPLQLRHRGFVELIKSSIAVDAHAAAGLELEITESLIMENVNLSIESLNAIRAMGVRVAIDDFGTGFSSLSYLSRLPVDTLKIDRSFVNNITTGQQGLALVATIINLARALNLNVVAEGVETEEESRQLRLLGCDEIQGYLFSEPLPCEVFEERYLSQCF